MAREDDGATRRLLRRTFTVGAYALAFATLAALAPALLPLCARAFSREVTECFGPFAVLRDGLVCTLEDLPTGAIRAIMACAGCQTTLMW